MGEESGGCVLDTLKSIEGCSADAVEECVAIVKAGGDEGVNESLSCRAGERGTEFGNIADVEK